MWSSVATALRHMSHEAARLARDEAAVTAIEYALLGFLIAVVASVSISVLGGGVGGLWTLVSNAVVGAL